MSNKPMSSAAQQECPEGGRHEPMHDDTGVSCRWCKTPLTSPTSAALATHDLRHRTWGHNIEFLRRNEDGTWQAVIYLTARLRPGDAVLTKGKRDGVPADLRYVIVGPVDTPMDPGEQHFVTLAFAPEEGR